MRQVWGAMTNSVVIVWAIVLYGCFNDFRFPAAWLVGVIGLALIVLLINRVGLALMRAVVALALIVAVIALIADEPARRGLVSFLNDLLVLDCPRAVVWATTYTIGYAILRLTRPAVQRAA